MYEEYIDELISLAYIKKISYEIKTNQIYDIPIVSNENFFDNIIVQNIDQNISTQANENLMESNKDNNLR